jgi:hypothetical protein
MNQIHDAMRISLFLNWPKQNVKDDNQDVFADSVQAHSIFVRATETEIDKE